MGKRKGKKKAGKVDWQDQARFWRRFWHLISSGVNILESIELAGGECRSPALIKALVDARDKFRRGVDFSGALEEHSDVFPLIRNDLVCDRSAAVLTGASVAVSTIRLTFGRRALCSQVT